MGTRIAVTCRHATRIFRWPGSNGMELKKQIIQEPALLFSSKLTYRAVDVLLLCLAGYSQQNTSSDAWLFRSASLASSISFNDLDKEMLRPSLEES